MPTDDKAYATEQRFNALFSLLAPAWTAIPMATSGGWAAATPVPGYRLLMSGVVQLRGAFIFTASGTGLSGNNPFTTALPSAFWPASLQYVAAGVVGGSATPVITANRSALISVSTAGILSIVNVSSGGTSGQMVDLTFCGCQSYQLLS
jgi:hypothetical protein